MTKNLFFVLFATALFCSCASSYKSIEPQSFNFSNTELDDGITLKYRYDILRERGNKKFAKDETKHRLRVVAVEITNNNDFDVTFDEDLKLFSGESEVELLSPLSTTRLINQCAACYLPYGLLTFMTFQTSNGSTQTSTPIGYVVGPVVTGLNVIKASSANKKLKRVLLDYNLLGFPIKSGETVTGLITIDRDEYTNLKPRLIRN